LKPYFFFSSSLVAPDELLESLVLAGGVAGGLLGVELLPEVAPPEAAPELDLGAGLGVGAELPPEGEVDEDELEPELDGGGVEDVLDLPLPLSWPQAARPKAMATASASVESFMCPPWLGIRKKAAKNGPGVNP
jgi:hypothetical protein